MKIVCLWFGALWLAGCSGSIVNDNSKLAAEPLASPIKEFSYQGCQYLIVEHSGMSANNYSFSMTHKGNCTNH